MIGLRIAAIETTVFSIKRLRGIIVLENSTFMIEMSLSFERLFKVGSFNDYKCVWLPPSDSPEKSWYLSFNTCFKSYWQDKGAHKGNLALAWNHKIQSRLSIAMNKHEHFVLLSQKESESCFCFSFITTPTFALSMGNQMNSSVWPEKIAKFL